MNSSINGSQQHLCYAAFNVTADPPFVFSEDTKDLAAFFECSESDMTIVSLSELFSASEKEMYEEQLLSQTQENGEAELLVTLEKNGKTFKVFLKAVCTLDTNGKKTLYGIMTKAEKLFKLVNGLKKESDEFRFKLSQTEIMVNDLQIKAEQDSLTKLLNASTSRKLAEDYLKKSKNSCAVIVIDIDDFKVINDRYGHMTGDNVLVCAAQAIRNQFRSQDIVGRIGGDEFLVLMKEVPNPNIVKLRCSQVIDSVRNLQCTAETSAAISCSIGAVLSTENQRSYIELFHSADNALYRAKILGKNRFELVE